MGVMRLLPNIVPTDFLVAISKMPGGDPGDKDDLHSFEIQMTSSL